MPQKSIGARRGNQGNHNYPRITVKTGILEGCTTLHRQKSRKPFYDDYGTVEPYETRT
jgi:hypothetical protein